MKKIIAILLLAMSTSTFAHGYYRSYGYHNDWVAPAIIGGVVGYSLARPYYVQPTYVQPVYVQQQPNVVYVQQPAPLNYHQESILDANCNCYRTVWVPN